MSLTDDLQRLGQRVTGKHSSVEDERLVELFRNRNELKKELAALEEERHRLLDRLKLQEGATLRVQEKLDALEEHLGKPEAAFSSIAHFQLCGVWRAASRRLALFSGELERQQRDRERKSQMSEFDRNRRARAAECERELVEARVLSEQLQSEQQHARQRVQDLQGFFNQTKRREITAEIDARAQRLESALTEVSTLSDKLRAIEAERAPPLERLSVDGRRAVNLAAIAYAESLCDRLAENNLGELARDAKRGSVFQADYGDAEACRALMERTEAAISGLERMNGDLSDIKMRTDRIRRTAAYRSPADVVPMPESVTPPADGLRAPLPNPLLDEYWEIYEALVR